MSFFYRQYHCVKLEAQAAIGWEIHTYVPNVTIFIEYNAFQVSYKQCRETKQRSVILNIVFSRIFSLIHHSFKLIIPYSIEQQIVTHHIWHNHIIIHETFFLRPWLTLLSRSWLIELKTLDELHNLSANDYSYEFYPFLLCWFKFSEDETFRKNMVHYLPNHLLIV